MNQAVKTLFSSSIDTDSLLLGLSAISSEQIVARKTLLFLDEVQEIPEVVASLKYFCEDKPDIYIVVAGSLLGIMNMEGCSFPTGKVDIMHLFPMTFIEFLWALKQDNKAKLLYNAQSHDIVNSLASDYIDLLRQYYYVGGMPEAVKEFITTKDTAAVRRIQTTILTAYEADIAKHAGTDTQRARMVFQSVPSQLAKENKKFIFGALKKGARAADYENAIQWLVDAGLIYKVCRVSKVALPLNFYIEKDNFKLFMLDVGLLGAMAQVPATLVLIGNNIFAEYKGAFTENYVLTQMITYPDTVISYYSKTSSTLELDFVVQTGTKLLPIEVKAEENVHSKSLKQFINNNGESTLHGYRFSMKGFITQEWMSNIPLYAAGPFIELNKQ